MDLWDDFKKPFNIFTTLLAIVSIVAAFIFYYGGKKEAAPTYMLSQSALKIFDSRASSPAIRLSDRTGRLISEDVYLAELIFWNSGRLPIEPSDVREPVRIVITPATKILDYKIVQQTKPEIAGIELGNDSSIKPKKDTSSIVLKWRHLDPNFGAKIQVIYSSPSPAVVTFDGYIVGTNGFLAIPPKGESITNALMNFAVGAGVAMCVALLGMIIEAAWKKELKRLHVGRIIFFILCVVLIAAIKVTLLSPIKPPL